MKTVIFNGRPICGDSIIPKGYVTIEDGKITEIGAGGPTAKSSIRPIEAGAHWIDAEGHYICPGFIDLHVHGVGVCDLYKDPIKALRKMSKILSSQGVTSYLPTLITAPLDKIINSISLIANNKEIIEGANAFGINLEGPYINPEKRGAHPKEFIRPVNIAEIKSIIKAADGMLKIMTLAPELQNALEAARLLGENSVISAVGHTNASFDEAMHAIDNGFKYFTHLFNGMPVFHHRNPGALVAFLMKRDVYAEIIADGVHVHPAVVKLICHLRDKDKIVIVTDALAGIMRKGDKAEFAQTDIESNGTCAYNAEGTIMGSVLPMNKAIQNIVQFTDLSITSAIKLATINPANIMGISNKKGSIDIGKDADIVILGEDFSIKSVLIAGKII